MSYDVELQDTEGQPVEVPSVEASTMTAVYLGREAGDWVPAEANTSFNVNACPEVSGFFGPSFGKWLHGKTGAESANMLAEFARRFGDADLTEYDPWSTDPAHVAHQFAQYAAWAEVYPDAKWYVV